MNILLINHYAGSPDMGMEFRPYYMAREWVKKGHKVHFIAADFSHLRRKNPEITEDFQEEIIDGIHYHWVKTVKYDGNGVKRFLTMLQFVGKIRRNAKRILESIAPDVVITSSTYPLDTYAGQKLVKKSKKPVQLIHEIHDMWPVTPIELYHMPKWHPFVILMQWGENSFCKHADKVVSLLCNAKEYLMEHGMSEDKFVHISNGIVKEEWEHPEPLEPNIKQYISDWKKENKFIICFFGSVIHSYALSTLLDAVKQLNNSRLQVVIVGNGIDKQELVKKSKNNSQVHFFEPIPKNQIPSLLEEVDAIYVAGKGNSVFRFGVCMNKLFDSMMSGKPLLYAVDAPNNYVLDYRCGVSVEAENVDELTKGIEKLLSASTEELYAMGQRGRQAVLENFTYDILADKFLDVMKY